MNTGGVYRNRPNLTQTLIEYRRRREGSVVAAAPPPPPPPPPVTGIPFSPPFNPVQSITGLLIR